MTDITKSRTDIGVLVGRFQVPDLHDGHQELIAKVAAWHKKFLLVLGCSPNLVTRRKPLDFQARKLMINAHYPEIPMVPLMDCADDEEWSRELDRRVREVFPVGTVTLYGGRDSFIPYYRGQFPCQEVEPSSSRAWSGSSERKSASLEVRSNSDWRAGVVYGAYNRDPQALATVDVAVTRKVESGGVEILLARKPGERGYRLIGGFVDPTDVSLEAAARREVMEEAHIEISNPLYAGSFQVDDWRYRNEVDKIITSVFMAEYTFGPIQPDDDIEELRWFRWNGTLATSHIVDAHRPLILTLVDQVAKREAKPLEERATHELPAQNR
jgi:bifunctional NMN adenylyltransferase/nudix hydrolase